MRQAGLLSHEKERLLLMSMRSPASRDRHSNSARVRTLEVGLSMAVIHRVQAMCDLNHSSICPGSR